MDAKLMVDIATGVMEEYGVMGCLNERNTQIFCERLEAAFKDAAPVEAAVLTDEEITTIKVHIGSTFQSLGKTSNLAVVEFARAIEARIKGEVR